MSTTKDQIKQQIEQQAGMAQARNLIETINRQCFKRCIQKPASTLSSSEQNCYTLCMEKYMNSWSTVHKTYISWLQQEQGKRQMLGGGGGGMFGDTGNN